MPWVTRWSEEALGGVLPCPELGGRLAIAQTERPGKGRPIYSENHLPRQRRSALQGLCPMCGRPTSPGDRWSLTAKRSTAGELRERGLEHLVPAALSDRCELLDAGSIAPLHRDCASRSASECPHLRSSATMRLIAFPARTVLIPLTTEARPTTGAAALAQPLRPVAVISFIQIVGVFD